MMKKRGKKTKLEGGNKLNKKDKEKHIDLSYSIEKNLKKEYKAIKHFFNKKHNFLIKQKEEKQQADKKLIIPFGILFMLSIILYVFTFLNESWVAAGISIVIMFSSFILFRIEKKIIVLIHGRLFVLYLLVWISSLTLFILSIIAGNTFSATLSVIVIFFCSLASALSGKKKNNPSLRDEIMELRYNRRYITDLDKILMLLEKYKRLKVSSIIEGFNIDKETVEGWIDLLEQHGLLKVRFPIFSGMEITLIEDWNKNKDSKIGKNDR